MIIDCATTASCGSGRVNGQEQCSEWSLFATIAQDLNFKIFKVGLDTTFTYGQSLCTTAEPTNACTWTDDQCHSTWVSTVKVIAHRHIRRRCNFARGGSGVPVRSKDLGVAMPQGTLRWGCAATCDDGIYPASVSPVSGM